MSEAEWSELVDRFRAKEDECLLAMREFIDAQMAGLDKRYGNGKHSNSEQG